MVFLYGAGFAIQKGCTRRPAVRILTLAMTILIGSTSFMLWAKPWRAPLTINPTTVLQVPKPLMDSAKWEPISRAEVNDLLKSGELSKDQVKIFGTEAEKKDWTAKHPKMAEGVTAVICILAACLFGGLVQHHLTGAAKANEQGKMLDLNN